MSTSTYSHRLSYEVSLSRHYQSVLLFALIVSTEAHFPRSSQNVSMRRDALDNISMIHPIFSIRNKQTFHLRLYL